MSSRWGARALGVCVALLVLCSPQAAHADTDIWDLAAAPRLARDLAALGDERLEPVEGFMLSRINGVWSVRSILKLCPVPEEEAWRVLEGLVARGLVVLRFREPSAV